MDHKNLVASQIQVNLAIDYQNSSHKLALLMNSAFRILKIPFPTLDAPNLWSQFDLN